LQQPKTLTAYFLRYKWRYLIGFACLVGASFVVMLPPVVLGRAIDAITAGTTARHLLLYAGLILALGAVEGGLRFFSRLYVSGTSRLLEYDLRDDLAEHLLSLDQHFYMSSQTGDLMARCTNDTQRVRDLAGPAVVEIGRAIMMMITGFIFMAAIDLRLALIAVAYFPAVGVVLVRFRGTVEDRYQAVQDQFGALSNRVQESLSGIRTVKAYAQEDSDLNAFTAANVELMRRTMAWAYYMGIFWPLMVFVAGLSIALVLWFGGNAVVQGELSIGQFVQFNIYLAILSAPLMSLGWTVTIAQQGIASMRRISEVMQTPPRISDPAEPLRLERPGGEVEFRDVTFGYYEQPVLEHLSLVIPSGSTVAIVGGTGAGKTTLIGLLVRLYDPWLGQVLLDGVDVRDLEVRQLRELVGFVPQETFLFSDTLRENIALANETAGDGELDDAVQTSQLVNDLAQFTFGLDTPLGERGMTLSGGQKQRAALARALVKGPPVLVLDDALSHVDTHTEEEILRRLRGFMRQRTTIIIAHRTSTLASADVIVVLEGARIAERGTHEELLALDGVYARYYRKQLLAERAESGTARSGNGDHA
jgi:ATP-binding cassette subfamily B protein